MTRGKLDSDFVFTSRRSCLLPYPVLSLMPKLGGLVSACGVKGAVWRNDVLAIQRSRIVVVHLVVRKGCIASFRPI